MSTLKDKIYNILEDCYSFAKEEYSIRASIRVMDEIDKEQKILRPAVRWFAEEMEKDLRKNDFKDGWLDGKLEYYWQKANKHLMALRPVDSVRIVGKGYAIKRCAKAANYLMMFAHNLIEELNKEKANV